jgi:mercuric ion binding protein
MIQPLAKCCFLLALLTFIGIVPVVAQVEKATVAVDGMACPFCAFGIEKRLKKVGGVGSIEVDVAAGTASMVAAEGGSIAFVEIPEAIRKAGFTAGAIHLTVVGILGEVNDGQPLLTVGQTDQEILLVNLADEIRSRIVDAAAAGLEVRLSGLLHLHADGPPALEPDTVEALER